MSERQRSRNSSTNEQNEIVPDTHKGTSIKHTGRTSMTFWVGNKRHTEKAKTTEKTTHSSWGETNTDTSKKHMEHSIMILWLSEHANRKRRRNRTGVRQRKGERRQRENNKHREIHKSAAKTHISRQNRSATTQTTAPKQWQTWRVLKVGWFWSKKRRVWQALHV